MTLLLQAASPPSTPVSLEGLLLLLGAACVPLVVPAGKALIALLETLTKGRQQRMKIIEQLRKQQAEDREFFTTMVNTAQARADQAFTLSNSIRQELEQEREKRRLLAAEVASLNEKLVIAEREAQKWREYAATLEADSVAERGKAKIEMAERDATIRQLRIDLEAAQSALATVQESVKTLEKKDTDKLDAAKVPDEPPSTPPPESP